MPKKIKNCFYKNLTFQKLMEAHKRAKVHKVYKKEIIEFEFNLENNIINLLNNIKNRKYHLGNYHEFIIYEPKKRIIKSLPYVDRIVHQWKKYISDKELLNFTKLLIFDGQPSSNQVGIPIGNYTSQFFANIYLNELDQFVKRTLKVKYYVRYMDDFILLAKTKDECINLKSSIEIFLKSHLHLTLNNKSGYYPYKMGVNFCGYRIFTTHRLLRLSSKKKIKKNVKNWNYLYSKNKLDIKNTILCLNSWLGHSSHCNSYKLQNKILNNCNFLMTANTYENIEKDLIYMIENDSKKAF